MDMSDSAETHSEGPDPVGGSEEITFAPPKRHPNNVPAIDEKVLDMLLEWAFGFIAILAADMTILYVSPSIEDVSGHKREELVGINGLDLVHPDDSEELVRVISEGIKVPGKVEHVEFRLRRKDGSWSVVEAIGSNLLDEPLIGGVVLNAQDITEFRRVESELRNSEEQYRYLVENLDLVIFTVDVDGLLTYVSPAVESRGGFKADELVGRNFTDFVYPEDLPALLESFNRVLEGNVESYEFRIKDKDGSLRYLKTLSRPIMDDGEVRGLLGTMREITMRVEAQEAMRRNEEHFKALIRRQIRYYHANDQD